MSVFRSLRSAPAAWVLAAGVTACGGQSGVASPSGAPVGMAALHGAASLAVHFHGRFVPPAGSIYLGAFVAPDPNPSPAEQIADTAAFEQQIGRKLAINLHYHLWSDTLAGSGEQDDVSNKRIPMISWSCVDSDKTGVTDYDIAQGTYDSLIAKRAAAVAALRSPVFLRYKWEMNLVYNPQCADSARDIHDPYGKPRYSPTEFVAAWQHIRKIFVQNGATNVIWLWNPSGDGEDPWFYYPGDDKVDWVAVDWYDSFDQFFAAIYSDTTNPKTGHPTWTYPYLAARFPDKPLMIGETGAEQSFQTSYFDGDASDPSALQALQKSFPNIRAYVYWDSKSVRGNFQILAPALPAFTAFATAPYMSAYEPGPSAR